MADTFVHSLFGVIDVADDDYWEANVQLGDRTIQLDLNTDLGVITDDAMQRVDWFIDRLADVEQAGRDAIRLEHHQPDGDARLYQHHHLSEISDSAFVKLVGAPKPSFDDFDAFLGLCRLQRVGLYVENDQQFAIVDFTLGTDVTDYLLSVSFDSSGAARSVSMES